MAVYEKPGDWGTTFITKLRDADGNVFKWFGSYDLGRDAVVDATWTVKNHDEFKGVKETVVTRPKIHHDYEPKVGATVRLKDTVDVEGVAPGTIGRVDDYIPRSGTVVVFFGDETSPRYVDVDEIEAAA